MIRYKTVIVDDEKKSREMLKNLLLSFCPEVECIGMADSVAKGVALINETRPDIVLLDIEMQSGTGFDLLAQLDELDFEIIFTTAYKQYAIKAIKVNALDYLLKPIDVKELKSAIEKAIERRKLHVGNENLMELVNSIANKQVKRISISTLDSFIFIEIDQIIRCEARGAYTVFYLKSGSSVTASKNLKEYEQILSDFGFLRIHASHLINLSEVQKYIRMEGTVQLKDGSKIAVSANKKDIFLHRMR